MMMPIKKKKVKLELKRENSTITIETNYSII